jgi:leader peptidase (prepilin peptidase)/N-methyltransferase
MVVGLLLSALTGWLVGGIANWLADQLPHLPHRSLTFGREQYQASLLLPWRVRLGTEDARPWRRTLLAGGMAVAFAVGWLCFGNDWGQLLVGWFYTAWLLLVLVIDFEHRRVLNLMLPPAILVALLAPLLTLLGWGELPGYGSALLGGGAGFLAFLAIFLIGRGRMMGAGDVKLAGVIGLMTGYPLVWGALAAGIFLGGIAAILIIIRSRASAKSYMAYGPYLAMGALLVLWFYWP